MNLARRFRDEGHRILCFDTLANWKHDFDKIPYFVVSNAIVTDVREEYEFRGYSYFTYNRQYNITKEPFEALRCYQDLLYVITIQNPDQIGIFIASILGQIYRQNYATAFKYGVDAIDKWTIAFIEEAENVFDSASLTKRAFNRIRKQYSEMANLKMAVVSSSQRLTEVSTKFRSKMDFLIGCITLDDYELKVRRLLRHSKHREDVLKLEVGSFLWCPTDEIIKFPKWQQDGKPFDITSKFVKREQPQPEKRPQKNLWQKLREFLGEPEYKVSEPKYDVSAYEDTEEAEDNEWLEESEFFDW